MFEIIVMVEEEGVCFGVGFFVLCIIIGKVIKEMFYEMKDIDGIIVVEVMVKVGFDVN